MQVAVARVEDVRDHACRGALGDRVDRVQHLGQRGPGDDGVVQVVVRRDAADCAEGGLAALPQPFALAPRWRPGRTRAGARHIADLATCDRRPRREGLDLDQQDGVGIDRVAPHGRSRSTALDDPLVHHLERGRHDAGRDDGSDRARACRDGPNRRSIVRTPRVRRQAHRDPRRDAERALAARRTRRGGRARGSASRPPSIDDVAVGSTTSTARTWCSSRRTQGSAGRRSSSATLPPIVQTCWLEGSGAK